MNLEFRADANRTKKTRESQKLKGEFGSQAREPVRRDNR